MNDLSFSFGKPSAEKLALEGLAPEDLASVVIPPEEEFIQDDFPPLEDISPDEFPLVDETLLDTTTARNGLNASPDNSESINDDWDFHCETCGELIGKMEYDPETGNGNPVNIQCSCEKERIQRMKDEEIQKDHQDRVRKLRRDSLMDSEHEKMTFDADDREYPEISDKCKWFADNFQLARDEKWGLLLLGKVGNGKTHMAAAVGNRVLGQGFSVIMATVPPLIEKMRATKLGTERIAFFDKLKTVDLLILDDVGSMRDTPDNLEQFRLIVDARYTSGLPLVVTTNLEPDELIKPDNPEFERIYDRISQMCSERIPMTGPSRRGEIAAKKRAEFEKLYNSYRKGKV